MGNCNKISILFFKKYLRTIEKYWNYMTMTHIYTHLYSYINYFKLVIKFIYLKKKSYVYQEILELNYQLCIHTHLGSNINYFQLIICTVLIRKGLSPYI